jgi:F420-dependent oxidoreductase-like protein
MELAIMIEGQNGLNWPRWQKLAQAVDNLGFVGLYRSDHFTNSQPPDIDSLELWVSLTWLASHTRRIQFGPLVSPVSFRDPVFTARMAMQVDELSGERLQLGLGAGWQEREHELFDYPLLDPRDRFRRFEEGLQVITQLMRSDEPVTFTGDYYRLREALLLPKSSRPGGPPIVVGGNGPKYTLPVVVKYAHEWNCVALTVDRFANLNAHLDLLLKKVGRKPIEVKRSMMTNLVFGRSEDQLQQKLKGRRREDLIARGGIVGTPAEVIAQLRSYSAVGLERIMLQWLDLDDLAGLEELAGTVLPQV